MGLIFHTHNDADHTQARVSDIQVVDTLNSLRTLSFSFIADEDRKVAAKICDAPFSEVEVPDDNQRYLILSVDNPKIGIYRQYSITAVQVGKKLHWNWVKNKVNGTQSLENCLKMILPKPFTYQIHGKIDNYSFSEEFGGGYADELLEQLAGDFKFEWYFDNYTLHVASQIGQDEAFLFIDNLNCQKINIQYSDEDVQTVITGYASPKPIMKEVTKTETKTRTLGTAADWAWPFPDVGEGHFDSAQLFGVHPGGGFRRNGFHDGLDFGTANHPGNAVHAVHDGTVTIKSYMSGLQYYVVISGGGYNVVYQEAFSSPGKIAVNVGQSVKKGDIIGYRDTDHLHLGITRANFNYAVSRSFSNDGTWLDPQSVIRNGSNGGQRTENYVETTKELVDTGEKEYTVQYTYKSPYITSAGFPEIMHEDYVSEDNLTQDGLIKKLKEQITDYPSVQYTIDTVNFKKFSDYIKSSRPGDYGWLKDRLGVDVKVRISSVTYSYQDASKADAITFGNKRLDPVVWSVNSKKAYEENIKLGKTLQNELMQVRKESSLAISMADQSLAKFESMMQSITRTSQSTSESISESIKLSESASISDWLSTSQLESESLSQSLSQSITAGKLNTSEEG
ncbi:phage tail protein [Ligilactobacillus equi]|nr:phage tail protein [Ligilactobacillus equi]